jgi:hypothetical protein
MSDILHVKQPYIVQMWNGFVSKSPGLVFVSHIKRECDLCTRTIPRVRVIRVIRVIRG